MHSLKIVVACLLLICVGCLKQKQEHKKQWRFPIHITVKTLSGAEIEFHNLQYRLGFLSTVFSDTFELTTGEGVISIGKQFQGIRLVEILGIRSDAELRYEIWKRETSLKTTESARMLRKLRKSREMQPGVKMRLTYATGEIVEGIQRDRNPYNFRIYGMTRLVEMEIKIDNISSIKREVKSVYARKLVGRE